MCYIQTTYYFYSIEDFHNTDEIVEVTVYQGCNFCSVSPSDFVPHELMRNGLQVNCQVRRIGRDDAFRPKGRGFEFRSSLHVGTLGKSFTHSCLWRFAVKFRHSICAVVGSASE